MKTRLLFPLVILLAGCATLGDAVLPAVAKTAGLAAEWAVKKYPDQRPEFDAAQRALTIYLQEETLTLDNLVDVLRRAGLDETGWAGPNGDLYIQAGLVVWELLGPVNHVIIANKYVQQVGLSVRDGLVRGLAATAPTAVAVRAAPEPTYEPRKHVGPRVLHK